MNEATYDLFVIGTGMSGASIAMKSAKKGLKTGIADNRPFGGTCALRGCDPKKILIDVAKAKNQIGSYAGKGLQGEGKINWPDLMKFKNDFTDPVPDKMEKNYQKAGIDTYHATTSFMSEDTLQVGDTIIKAKKIVIATGARPRKLGIPGEEYTITSDGFFHLDALPDSIAFLGGGYVAFEFAHLAAQAGAKVTILDRGDFPLKHFEQELVTHILDASKAQGIDVLLNAEVKEVRKIDGAFQIIAQSSKGERIVETALVVNSSGRVPQIDQLDLEKGNIDFDKKEGIKVNEYLQSISNAKVYAAGDVAATTGLPLTPVAVYEGHFAASNILKGNEKETEYIEMPTVVFTNPPLASVGLTEEKAKEQHKQYEVKSGNASQWFNAYRSQAEVYAYKVLISKEDDTILGAHITGPSAEETINLFALAMKAKIPAKTLKTMVYSYPSWASDLSYMV
ncbi:MAG: NAD(P)/FAD-dependent oxidoreductase [Fulvivirga sp.]